MSILTNTVSSSSADTARLDFLLRELMHALADQNYDFVPPTPSTHARVIARPDRCFAQDLAGVFGWSLPFDPKKLSVPYLDELLEVGVFEKEPAGLLRARFRVARLHGKLFVHSAYPTNEVNSVFLGPDSYRFADFIAANVLERGELRIADYGAGAGVGGIVAAISAGVESVTIADINPNALALAALNCQFAGLEPIAVQAQSPSDLDGEFDVIVTHPPFMIDEERRMYRDGGGLYGGQLSRDWVLASLPKLTGQGKVIMHTGAPIVRGKDVLYLALYDAVPAGFQLDYRELDPDIFGEEMSKPAYADVDRIAAVGVVVTRLSS